MIPTVIAKCAIDATSVEKKEAHPYIATNALTHKNGY